MSDKIYITILAAGFGERFRKSGGSGAANKLLYRFNGKPLVAYALDLAVATADIERVFFVAACDEVAALAGAYPGVVVIRNERPERGIRESVRLGTLAVLKEFNHGPHGPHERQGRGEAYCLFMHGDQPFLTGEVIDAIIAARKPGCIAEPVPCEAAPGVHGTPTLFSLDFADELINLRSGESPRVIKERRADKVIAVPVEGLCLRDIDMPGNLMLT